MVAHEVTNEGHDRSQLTNMTRQAKHAMAADDLKVLADRGYFSSEEILGCEQAGATPYVPRPLTSGAKPTAGSASRTSSTSPNRTRTAVPPVKFSPGV